MNKWESDPNANCFGMSDEEKCKENPNCEPFEYTPWGWGWGASTAKKHCKPKTINPVKYGNAEWNEYVSFTNKNLIKPFDALVRERYGNDVSNDLIADLTRFRDVIKREEKYVDADDFMMFVGVRILWPRESSSWLYNMWGVYKSALSKLKQTYGAQRKNVGIQFTPPEFAGEEVSPVDVLKLIKNIDDSLTLGQIIDIITYWQKRVFINVSVYNVVPKWVEKYNELREEIVKLSRKFSSVDIPDSIIEHVSIDLRTYADPQFFHARENIVRNLREVVNQKEVYGDLVTLLLNDGSYDQTVINDLTRLLQLKPLLPQNGGFGTKGKYYDAYLRSKNDYMMQRLL